MLWCKHNHVEPDVLKDWKIFICFLIIDTVPMFHFILVNTNLLPPKPKSSFTLKRELIGTNAYKLHASLSERVLLIGMDVIQPKHLLAKRENQDKVSTLYVLPKLH